MRYFFIVIASLFFTTLCHAQFTFENIDTAKTALKGIEVSKSVQLVRNVITAFISGGNPDNIAMNCDLPMTIEGTTYTTTKELSEVMDKIIQAATKSGNNPSVKKVGVLGRRHETLNGFVDIDLLYVLGVIEFNINGQRPQKLMLFAIRNPNDPRIVGMYAE